MFRKPTQVITIESIREVLSSNKKQKNDLKEIKKKPEEVSVSTAPPLIFNKKSEDKQPEESVSTGLSELKFRGSNILWIQ